MNAGRTRMVWGSAASLFFLIVFAALAAAAIPKSSEREGKQVAPGVLEIGRIQHPAITESSGVVVSRTQPGVFWTHTDGGGRKQVLYAMSRQGMALGEFLVSGALVHDWEDIATDDAGHIYVGDIGNNNARRFELAVHQVDEPKLAAHTRGTANILRTWRLRFPAKPFDCESLFIWKDYGYVISKVFNNEHAGLYRFSLTNSALDQTLELVTPLKIDSPVTGADISPDGRLLGIVAKNGAYVYKIKGDPARAGDVKAHHTKFKHEHVEACTFVPEGLLATAESREVYLFTDEEFREKAKK